MGERRTYIHHNSRQERQPHPQIPIVRDYIRPIMANAITLGVITPLSWGLITPSS